MVSLDASLQRHPFFLFLLHEEKKERNSLLSFLISIPHSNPISKQVTLRSIIFLGLDLIAGFTLTSFVVDD